MLGKFEKYIYFTRKIGIAINHKKSGGKIKKCVKLELFPAKFNSSETFCHKIYLFYRLLFIFSVTPYCDLNFAVFCIATKQKCSS